MDATLIKIETELDLAIAIMRILHQKNKGGGLLAKDLVKAVQEAYGADETEILGMLERLNSKYHLFWQHVTRLAPDNGTPPSETIKWELIFTSTLSSPVG